MGEDGQDVVLQLLVGGEVLGSVARRVLRGRPAVARVVSRCAGAAMVVIGAALLLAR